MSELITQIRELAPSAKEPLFRRLLAADNLSYLRENDDKGRQNAHIIGFEVDTSVDQALAGFTLIGIGKHTIYAYCSDLQEAPRLILFPSLEKLFDPDFELLHLQVTKKRFSDSSFRGEVLGSGQMKDLVKDLTPPEKQIDIPASVVEAMATHMMEQQAGAPLSDHAAREVPVAVTKEVPVAEEPDSFVEEPDSFTEEPPESFDSYESGFDSYESPESFDFYETPGFDSYETPESFDSYETPEPEEPAGDPRSEKLRAEVFESLSEVSDFCVRKLGVNKNLAVTLVNRALQSGVRAEDRVLLAVNLFCKLFDEKRI